MIRKIFIIVVIAGVAAVFLALFVLNFSNRAYYADSSADIVYYLALPLVLALSILAALRLPEDWRMAVALCFAVVPFAFYGVEGWLMASGETMGAAVPADTVHTGSDGRSKRQVILDLKREKGEGYPVMRAKSLLMAGPGNTFVPELTVGGKPTLPFASAPDSLVVSCNEGEGWIVYRSDENGFHNPPGAWARANRVALLGDSFAHGSCVKSEDNIAAHLEKNYGPALNLGVGGFGPLSMLATLREYLPAQRPPVVLWLYFEGNDLIEDLPFERRAPILMRYLDDPSFRQNLDKRRGDVRATLRAFLDAKTVEAMNRVDDPAERWNDFWQLYRLRERLGLSDVGLGLVGGVGESEFALFRRVLEEARRTVEGWNGQLVFVFLPEAGRYFGGGRNAARETLRRRVLETARALDLPVVDVHAAFAQAPDPRALFPYPGAHYNPQGYRVAAQAIDAYLRELPARLD